ncbi:TrkA family potassium uptake protein [Gloeocapsa sp. PCC 73106]|uniref:potassium channel family protein n=1 Tax=Gloeocapsa sp. PCC 73106 TaxID=102232 RepID=UPI0002ABB4E0|nr:NAD-binding protein [Gloeocapsa sp. PCC 73106]ELS00201.1 Kef-type K+ ransport system, predicted NAD-binding component [Gloeocapsa sp. PCC 73106]
MKPQVIVSGLGKTGYMIFKLLQRQGVAVVGISDRSLPLSPNEEIVIGDLRSPMTLIQAGVKSAQTLVLASDDDALNIGILAQARLLNPEIRIINRLFNRSLGERLDQTLTNHVSISVSGLAAPIFCFAASGKKAVGQLRLADQTWPIHEEVIEANHPWLGQKLKSLWENSERMLIYYLPSRGELDLISAILAEKELQLGDHLIIGSKPSGITKRASWIQKVVKAILSLKRYQDQGRPLFMVTLALIMTISLATFTYVFVNKDMSLVDIVYFSVGMITGAGGKEEVAEQGSDWIKMFTALMMIVGAGVVGICYALINDFVLGSRIRQFWDAARVPHHNHYIVCGLGGIGIEIVRQLHSLGQEVVVIESDVNNRFLHTARSLGVPVIVEDACMDSTLKLANINKARAILPVTSKDLVNVQIALTAKAIAPTITVVLRAKDQQFGQSVQDIFNFDTVLSPTDLSIHSFAAAALGGKILGNGITDDLLWIAIGILITPNHPFVDKSVQEAAIDANFVPLYLQQTQGKTIHSWNLLAAILEPADVLYLTIPATSLAKLCELGSSNLEIKSKIRA